MSQEIKKKPADARDEQDVDIDPEEDAQKVSARQAKEAAEQEEVSEEYEDDGAYNASADAYEVDSRGRTQTRLQAGAGSDNGNGSAEVDPAEELREMLKRGQAAPVPVEFEGLPANLPSERLLSQSGELTGTKQVISGANALTIYRDAEGAIKTFGNARGVVWDASGNDGRTFVLRGSNPPEIIKGQPFFKANGEFGIKGDDGKVITRGADFTSMTQGEKTVRMMDNGSIQALDANGDVITSQDAKGAVRSAIRDPNNADRLLQVQVGNRTWTRSLDQRTDNLWTADDGQQMTGDFKMDARGNLTVTDQKNKAERVYNSDGSQVLRDSEGDKRVRRVVDPEGRSTDFFYSSKGELVAMQMPDGSRYSKLPKAPNGPPNQSDRWVKDGTTDQLKEARSVDKDGNLHIKPESGPEVVKQTDGFERRQQDGKTVYVKEFPGGGYIQKNDQRQIVETKDALGRVRKFEHDEFGQIDRITYANKEVWNLKSDEWVKEGKPPGTRKGDAHVLNDGTLVETEITTDGGVKERIYKGDGALLDAVNGQFTHITPAGRPGMSILGRDAQGNPNKFAYDDEKGAYWQTEDGKNWKEFHADGKPTGVKDTFRMSVDEAGNITRKHFASALPTIVRTTTDGTKEIAFEDGRLLMREKADKSKTTFQYDKENKFTGTSETTKEGFLIEKDARGRVTHVKGHDDRTFEYNDKDEVIAFTKDGTRFEHKDNMPPGLYASGKTLAVGIMTVRADGVVEKILPNNSQVMELPDGQRITTLENGAMLRHNKDGLLTETVNVNGYPMKYGWTMKPDVLERPGPHLNRIEYGGGAVYTTEDGFNWKNKSTQKNYPVFFKVDNVTGDTTDRYAFGDVITTRLNGEVSKEHQGKTLDGVLDTAVKFRDNWWVWHNNKYMRDQKYQELFRDMSSEQMYILGYNHKPSNPDALRDELVASTGGENFYRGLRTKGSFMHRDLPGEKDAIQLMVNRAEQNAGYWSRDNSLAALQRENLNIMGSKSGKDRLVLDAAMRRMFQVSLQDHVRDGEHNKKYGNLYGDQFYKKSMELFAAKGRDQRSNEDMSRLFDLALGSTNPLNNWMTISAENIATDAHRQHYASNGGKAKIETALEEDRSKRVGLAAVEMIYSPGLGLYDGIDAIASHDFNVRQATDYLERGSLKPATALQKATGLLFANSENVHDILRNMRPEDQALYTDGQKLAESKTAGPMTFEEKKAYDFYQEMQTAMRGLHWWGKERKAFGYEAEIGQRGGEGTELSQGVVDIGGHWFNSHQENLSRIENMSAATFARLMEGASYEDSIGTRTSSKDKQGHENVQEIRSQFQKQLYEGMRLNLGAGEYIDKAAEYISKKVEYALEINRLADSDPAKLREMIPALRNMDQATFERALAGHKLNRMVADGQSLEVALQRGRSEDSLNQQEKDSLALFRKGLHPGYSQDEMNSLAAFYQTPAIKQFFDGRQVARELENMDTILSGWNVQKKLDQNPALVLSSAQKNQLAAFQSSPVFQSLAADPEIAKALAGLNGDQPSNLAKAREIFRGQLPEGVKDALRFYQDQLFQAQNAEIRRPAAETLKELGANYTREGREKALLTIASMTTAEREALKDNKPYPPLKPGETRPGYRDEINNWLKANFYYQSESAARKAADAMIADIVSGSKHPPNPPTVPITAQLYLRDAADYSNLNESVKLLSQAVSQDASLRRRLGDDPAFAARFNEAARLAVGGSEADFNRYIKPILETGGLPAQTYRDMATSMSGMFKYKLPNGETESRDLTMSLAQYERFINEHPLLPVTSEFEKTPAPTFHDASYFSQAVLNASPAFLKYLSLPAHAAEKEALLKNIANPQWRQLADTIYTQGEIKTEDKLRAYQLNAGIKAEEAKALLAALPDAEARTKIRNAFSDKFTNADGTQALLVDLIDEAPEPEKHEWRRLVRPEEWSTEVTLHEAERGLRTAQTGLISEYTRRGNILPEEELRAFYKATFDASIQGLNLTAEQQQMHWQAFSSAVEGFHHDKETNSEIIVNGALMAGAIIAAPVTGFTSLAALAGTAGVMVAGGVAGATMRYAMLGATHKGAAQFTTDFLKYSIITGTNLVAPQHLGTALGLGSRAGTVAAERALAQVAVTGITAEGKQAVTNGMIALVRNGLVHGGGVTDDAIKAMVAGLSKKELARLGAKELDDVARALCQSLKPAVDDVARGSMRAVWETSKQVVKNNAPSAAINLTTATAGNVGSSMAVSAIEGTPYTMEQFRMDVGLAIAVGGPAWGGGRMFSSALSHYRARARASAPAAALELHGTGVEAPVAHLPAETPRLPAGDGLPARPLPEANLGTTLEAANQVRESLERQAKGGKPPADLPAMQRQLEAISQNMRSLDSSKPWMAEAEQLLQRASKEPVENVKVLLDTLDAKLLKDKGAADWGKRPEVKARVELLELATKHPELKIPLDRVMQDGMTRDVLKDYARLAALASANPELRLPLDKLLDKESLARLNGLEGALKHAGTPESAANVQKLAKAALEGIPIDFKRVTNLNAEDLQRMGDLLDRRRSLDAIANGGKAPAHLEGLSAAQNAGLRDAIDAALEFRRADSSTNFPAESYRARLKDVEAGLNKLSDVNTPLAQKLLIADLLGATANLPAEAVVRLDIAMRSNLSANEMQALRFYSDRLSETGFTTRPSAGPEASAFDTAARFMQEMKANNSDWMLAPSGKFSNGDLLRMDAVMINLKDGEIRPIDFSMREKGAGRDLWTLQKGESFDAFMARTKDLGFSQKFFQEVGGMPSFTPGENMKPSEFAAREKQMRDFADALHKKMQTIESAGGVVPENLSYLADAARAAIPSAHATTALTDALVARIGKPPAEGGLSVESVSRNAKEGFTEVKLAERIDTSTEVRQPDGTVKKVDGYLDTIRVYDDGRVEARTAKDRPWGAGRVDELFDLALKNELAAADGSPASQQRLKELKGTIEQLKSGNKVDPVQMTNMLMQLTDAAGFDQISRVHKDFVTSLRDREIQQLLADARKTSANSPERSLAEATIREKLMDEAREFARKLGLVEKNPDGTVKRYLIEPQQIRLIEGIEKSGSYTSDNLLHINIDGQSPTSALRHEMRHMADQIDRTAFYKANPAAYEAAIRNDVLKGTGNGGTRLEQVPEGYTTARRANIADLAARQELVHITSDFLSEFGSRGLPDQKIMGEWLRARNLDPSTMQKLGGEAALLREIAGEYSHYRTVLSESVLSDPVLAGNSAVGKTVTDRASRYQDNAAKGANISNNPVLQRLTNGLSNDTVGMIDPGYYLISESEMRGRRTQAVRDIEELLKVKGKDSYEIKQRRDVIRFEESGARVREALEKYNTATDTVSRAEAWQKARNAAREWAERTPQNAPYAKDVGKFLIDHDLMTRAQLPENLARALPLDASGPLTRASLSRDSHTSLFEEKVSKLPDSEREKLTTRARKIDWNGLTETESETLKWHLDNNDWEGVSERFDEIAKRQKKSARTSATPEAVELERIPKEELKQIVDSVIDGAGSEIKDGPWKYDDIQRAKRVATTVLDQYLPGVRPAEIFVGQSQMAIILDNGNVLKIQQHNRWNPEWGHRVHSDGAILIKDAPLVPLKSADEGKAVSKVRLGKGDNQWIAYVQNHYGNLTDAEAVYKALPKQGMADLSKDYRVLNSQMGQPIDGARRRRPVVYLFDYEAIDR